MSTTTTTTLTNAIATNAIDRLVLDYARQATFLPNLVWAEDIAGQNTLTHVFPQFGSLTAAAATQGTDLTPTTLNVTEAASITVGEVAVLVELTRLGAVASGGRVVADIVGRQCGLAVADKVETDIGATFPSFSASVGTSGAAMALVDFDNALYTVRAANTPIGNPSNNNAPLQGYQAVLSEKQLSYFLIALRQANMQCIPAAQMEILNEAGGVPAQLRGGYMGVPFYASNDLTTANSAVDAVGAMFGPTAIGLVTIGGPQTMQMERPRGRSDDVVVLQWYGVGIVVNSYGCKIVNKAT